MRRPTLLVAASLLAVTALATGACDGLDPSEGSARAARPSADGGFYAVLEREIRPTDGDGWFGNGYGDVEIDSYDSEGGRFRVWFARTGAHTVPSAELPLPPLVALVADVADEVWALYIDTLGFAPPLPDDVYHDRPDYGGDGRVDIYLQDLEGADGYIVTEVCQNPPSFGCAGYFIIDYQYSPWAYASQEEAVRVLASHELFHLLQNAHSSGQQAFLSEGSATYMEEVFWPDQDDYEGFVRGFLGEPGRPLDHQRPGDFSDLRPYGAAIFFAYLAETHGVDIIREIWESTVSPEGEELRSLDAIDAALAGHDTNLEDAVEEFALWNGATGTRANPDWGYEGAERYREVPVETLDRDHPPYVITGELPKLAAAYHRIDLTGTETGAELRLRVETGDPRLRTNLLVERDGRWAPEPLGRDDDGLPKFAVDGAARAMVVLVDTRRKSNATQPYLVRVEVAAQPDPPPPDVVETPDTEAPDVATGEDIPLTPDATDPGSPDTGSPALPDATAGSETTAPDAGAGADAGTGEGGGGGGGCAAGSRSTPAAPLLLLLLALLPVALRRRRPTA